MGKRLSSVFWMMVLLAGMSSSAHAQMTIETAVSRSKVPVGDEIVLEIIVSDAQGKISKPVLQPFQGFSSYSRGHSQEISIINGKTTSRSVYSFVLVANAAGRWALGPFEVEVNGKVFQAPGVTVEVVPQGSLPSGQGPSGAYPSGPVVAPPPRAQPDSGITNQDIYVKAWLDKDETYVNEPVLLTYTIYTRLTSTYKGFEKEPVTTGFWVEDFPPEKTVRRTEQIINGSRYVVADIRKMVLFPTEAGIFTIEPGTISTTVEVRSQDDFNSFFSFNVFGRRSRPFPSSFATQIYSKSIPTEPLSIVVKALPEAGKPENFSGAVGNYRIESSLDKTSVEAGSPVTYRVKITGEGNINTLQAPVLPAIENIRRYDSSSSVNISKNRLVVEGEKITETVLVPRKEGTYTIPSLSFSYFEPHTGRYRVIRTQSHQLAVRPAPEGEAPFMEAGPGPAEKTDVEVMGTDIRYLKAVPSEIPIPFKNLAKNPLYWALNGALFLASILLVFLSKARQAGSRDISGLRYRRSHHVARRKLRKAGSLLHKGKQDAFYAEISRAVEGYFADKLNISSQMVTPESVEAVLEKEEPAEQAMADAKTLFEELSMGRFASVEKSREDMKKVYQLADRVITLFEKVKLKR